ncbi:MAG: hypothetical protein J7L15_05895 [Clostridiales bacterium]|nr:hypothetical protein [Clostridiales bacterium]
MAYLHDEFLDSEIFTDLFSKESENIDKKRILELEKQLNELQEEVKRLNKFNRFNIMDL